MSPIVCLQWLRSMHNRSDCIQRLWLNSQATPLPNGLKWSKLEIMTAWRCFLLFNGGTFGPSDVQNVHHANHVHHNNHPLKDESNDKALISPLQVHRSNNLWVCTTQFGQHPCHLQKIKTHPKPPQYLQKPKKILCSMDCDNDHPF